MKRSLLPFILILSALTASGQLVTDPTYTAQQLTDVIVGNGIAVSNIVLNCPTGASAYFNGGGTNLNMATGVMLTSGSVVNAAMNNNDPGASACNGAPGDPEVEGVANETTYDACILEFDIVPTCSQITFTYIFASEEYPEYVNQEFSDAMIISLTGPGFVGAQNIALVPGNPIPVGIQTVNGNTNSGYFVNNAGGATIQYDGFTVPMTATANVTSCQSYHVKIAVADAADCIFDSGVFVAEGSMDCGVNNAVTTDISVGPFMPIEGCRTYDIELCRQGDVSGPYDLVLSYGGSATNGVDYLPLPTLLNFPAGVQCQTLAVEAIEDGLFEGAENIQFVYQAVSGACTVNDTVQIQIIDDQNMNPAFFHNDVCLGSTVFFSNGTSITPPATVTNFTWKFGDGQQVNQYNSSHLYATEGDYEVWLIATSNDNCVDSVMNEVHVYGYPTSDFSFVDVCLGDPASFTNLSLPSSNDIFGDISWNFGDGGNANSWDGLHYYSLPDTFPVSLTVYTDQLSCATTFYDTIIVYAPIVTNYIHNDVCFGSTVDFVNNSVGNAIWEWDFDDGSPLDPSFNTSHDFLAPGIYDVRLVGISPNGCNDTTVHQVTVYDAPIASFATGDQCANELAQFTNTTVLPTYGALGSWYWLFSDNTNSSAYSPLHLFPTPGQYTATLVVYNEMLGCSDTATSIINLFPVPEADFTIEGVCLGLPTAPSNLSQGSVVTWSWDFGDGTPLVISQNPSHSYLQAGTFDVLLIATYTDQCADSTVHQVNIYDLPTADFTWDYVCEGVSTSFINHSSIPFPENIVSWIWDYGDATPLDTAINGSHFYPDGGLYNVNLNIVSGHGCTGSTSQPIWVNYLPDINATTTTPNGCPDLCVDFIDLSTIPFGEIATRRWNFGDFQFSTNVTETHCYDNDDFFDPSYYNIRLNLTSDSGCTSILTMDSLIEVYPVPYADFGWSPDSVSTFDPQVFFADKSYGADLWTWTFGDTNNYTPSYDQNPDFTYSDHGYHDIMLIAENNYGCVDTIVRTIYIYADIRFYVPSAFTPNEDGRNDIFRGFGEDIAGYNMRIFTRTGMLIFESNDIDYGWDGTVNGRQVPNGMYIYEFTVTDLNDQSKEYAGRFTLVR